MANISENKGLWFIPDDLQGFVDYPAWTRGKSLFLQNKVLDLAIEPDGVGWVASGRVQGSQRAPYNVRVEITLDPQSELVDWFTSCTCPVGEGCKHAVALTIKAAYQGKRLLGDAVATPVDAETAKALQARAEEALRAAKARLAQQAEEAAERQLLGWLQKVDAAGRTVRSGAGGARVAADRQEQYL